MSRCELSGKSPVVKNKVSHSNIKNKSKAFPNIQQKKLFSEALNQTVSLKIAASTIRTVDHVGGFDRYITQTDSDVLSKRAKSIQTKILRILRSNKKKKEA
jgi:large subunit ribosomal protein L28